ncbi:MAG TPA: alpha/beta fold hydrolase [Candidatus Binataceae bacterium]|nr:alpha/beta fold hydrolase [Candidatus Binataceae bacterium]
MNEQAVTFPSDELKLEGLLALPENAPARRGGVVCHPHPLYGGSMYNNVVDAALAAMWRLGWATLRFNFRGVGASEGEHANGIGEAGDAAAAVRFLTARAEVQPHATVLAGYSFGAMAAMAAAASVKDLGALVLIALPLQMADTQKLEQFPHPIILVGGDSDAYCPERGLRTLHGKLGARAELAIIEGADHFFGGYEEELAGALEGRLAAIAAAS